MKKIKPTRFGSRKSETPLNASGVVTVGPRRFLFVDNHDPDGLMEFALDDDMDIEWMRRRPLTGLADAALSDPEGLARIELNGAVLLIAASSLCVSGKRRIVHDGLVRIRYAADGDLAAEAIPGFRAWLLAQFPSLADCTNLTPDEGGLNIEGIAWQPHSNTLVLGLRGPVQPGKVGIIRMPIDVGRAWNIASLGKPILEWIRIPHASGSPGIRDLCFDEEYDEFLVLLGRSISGGDEPFQLCTWDGKSQAVEVRDIAFHHSAKPEGVTTFTTGGVPMLLVVDDGGGYAVFERVGQEKNSVVPPVS
ncbi:DUF3616 domain-containing protein [Aldersonia kunmingensis]|uniref:DUF3616 domain-containing protein n=1 Tax=Aldersonia kunmingensis TaxID=408066 RepID=UPI00082C7448|nr:DUF3616 domain-containing protein [Aldersonia kunmingensis]